MEEWSQWKARWRGSRGWMWGQCRRSQTGSQTPRIRGHIGFPTLHVRSIRDGKPHPVEARGVSNLTMEGCAGFTAALQGAPGPPAPCYRGIHGCPPLVTGRIYCPVFLGHLSLCHCLVHFPPPPSQPLHHQQLPQHHPELLRTPCQLPHPVSHLSGCSRGRILKRRRLRADHDVFEFFAEGVAALRHSAPHLRSLGLARQRVANEHQLVRAEDDELAVCHEYLGWLVGVDGGEEGVDGVGHRGDILLALLLVEEEELPVAMAQFGGGGTSRAVLGQLVGQWVVWGRDPARHVIVDWSADFLL